LGKGDFLVAEADESDGSFLQLSPAIAVVTTIDAEHLDYYRDLEQIKGSFLQFINKVPFYGCAVLCLDEENIQALLPLVKRRYLTYGLNPQADVVAEELSFQETESRFRVRLGGQSMGIVHLPLPGVHNVYNSLAAIAVAFDLGLAFETVQNALENMKLPERRFQIKGTIGEDVLVVDDYAHHPVEIRATLAAAKEGWGRRTVVVFQPHRYSRVRALMADFATAFYQADYLVITDIYAAGENPLPGVDAEQLAERVRQHGHRQVHYIPSLEEAAEQVKTTLQPHDMVLTLGAGNVGQVADELVKHF
jgi:UDP-N-acetylmuramate--alanine ligase